MIRQLKRIQTAALVFYLMTGTIFAADAGAKKASAASKAAIAKTDVQAEEKTIRATADAFVKAFNKADAKAIGAMWAPDAVYTDEHGVVFHGREGIQKEYEG